jgi:hypothetical protein
MSLLAAAHTGAAAATPHHYGVISALGNKISLVEHRSTTGTSIERNDTQSIPVPGGVFDRAAMLLAKNALRSDDAANQVELYEISDPALFENQRALLDGGHAVLPADMLEALRQDGATHLVLITKQRAEAKLRAGPDTLGSGYLEGLGFYIDHSVLMQRVTTGESDRGFLAPYLYARVLLIDLSSLAVVREVRITANFPYGAASNPNAGNTWLALTPAEKVQALNELLEEQIPKAVREAVGAN